jgi:hypothetical protein
LLFALRWIAGMVAAYEQSHAADGAMRVACSETASSRQCQGDQGSSQSIRVVTQVRVTRDYFGLHPKYSHHAK